FAFAVTPETLLIEGAPAGPKGGPVAEAAAWLHDRDIVEISFAPDVPPAALDMLLALLAEDVTKVREKGGPARVWGDTGHPAIAVQQIDFTHILQDRDVEHPARRKDDLWKAIVRAVLDRRKSLDEALQRRLLEIAGDSFAIGDLAQDVIEPNRAADGSPMLTTQAAAVVAAYRHLMTIIEVMAPDRRAEVIQNLATATANLDPHVVLEMLHAPDEDAASVSVKGTLVDGFDDMKVAHLLATTLAIDGQASGRLAEVFDTIASDEPRKRRVLTLTRSLLSESAFGRSEQFQAMWASMEELLLTYNERPFVSAEYKAGLERIGERAEAMAANGLSPDLQALVDTLGQDNVRRLSVTLLIDLLRLEHDRTRAIEVARDVAALGEDLLLAGDYESALMVTRALAREAATSAAIACEGSRLALDALAQTPAFVETVELLGDMTDAEAQLFRDVCEQIGPASVDALRRLLEIEAETLARTRAAATIRLFGANGASRLAPLVSSDRWYTQRNAADVLGEIGCAEAVPLLQPLLRGTDPRVLQSAVRALCHIEDPAAARAVHTVLRAATGDHRRAVVAALVAERDARVVPVLLRILTESSPLGSDHQIVL
ncbi:MAG TPA: HEAT repeat domain-containing protein, partial [Vicinamibacterales bacterium]|nr:HEAT repeat domain-containing protein [Vicinamibacterales bacterium]